MKDVRKADPAVRRQVVLVLVITTCVEALLIVGLRLYHDPLRDWILSGPGTSAQRVKLVFLLLASAIISPLLALAVYLWSLGGRILRAREFPPPGVRVIRDTPVITGERAVFRGRLLQGLALSCGIASVVLGLLVWRLASYFSRHAT
ncbi:MAG: hypothetical protein LAO31_21485 [Acidobacteriia bacterium]|nr:hypothetical protein [Terriglobia bacterium]